MWGTVLKVCNKGFILSKTTYSVNTAILRHYAAPPKRFYKNAGILRSGGKFEITLDQRKLKTPKGNIFVVDSEPLAIAVATEWDSQKQEIHRSRMHFTNLCNTVIDNPNNLTKYDIVEYITNYIDTDTVLFHAGEKEEDLYKLQLHEWEPVIRWFNDRYSTKIEKSRSMDGPVISDNDKNTLRKQLLSYNFAAVNGIVYAVDTIKSLILTMACVERFLTPDKAVLLSRLEEEFQSGHWGRVEWAHDLSQQSSQARLAAAILFVYFNSQSNLLQYKTDKKQYVNLSL